MGSGLAAWTRRHERKLIVAWLAGAALVLAALSLWILSGGADRAVDARRARWPAALDRVEALQADGQHAAALARLQQLDREFPAVSSKQRLDLERERLLRLLAQSHRALGNERRCLATLQRLVAFDRRNYSSHLLLARTAADFGEPAVAETAYRQVLTIHPNHLGAAEELAQLLFDVARFDDVIAVFEAYQDAFLLAPMTLRLGDVEVPFELLVDGAPKAIELPCALPAAWRGTACVETRGISVRLAELELHEAVVVGVPGERGSTHVAFDAALALGLREMSEPEPGLLIASGPGARCCTEAAGPPGTVARARLALTGYKPLTPSFWAMAEKSYENRLEHAALAAAAGRARVGGWPDAGTVIED